MEMMIMVLTLQKLMWMTMEIQMMQRSQSQSQLTELKKVNSFIDNHWLHCLQTTFISRLFVRLSFIRTIWASSWLRRPIVFAFATLHSWNYVWPHLSIFHTSGCCCVSFHPNWGSWWTKSLRLKITFFNSIFEFIISICYLKNKTLWDKEKAHFNHSNIDWNLLFTEKIDWDWVKNVWPVLGRVSHLWFGFGLIWKISLKNPKFFIFFSSDQKNLIGSGQKVPGSKTGQPLIYCGSKVCSGPVRAHLYLQLNFEPMIKR